MPSEIRLFIWEPFYCDARWGQPLDRRQFFLPLLWVTVRHGCRGPCTCTLLSVHQGFHISSRVVCSFSAYGTYLQTRQLCRNVTFDLSPRSLFHISRWWRTPSRSQKSFLCIYIAFLSLVRVGRSHICCLSLILQWIGPSFRSCFLLHDRMSNPSSLSLHIWSPP